MRVARIEYDRRFAYAACFPQDLKKKRKTIFQSAAKYVKQYQSSERNLIRMRRQARDNGNYFIEPSPKVVFVVRIRG